MQEGMENKQKMMFEVAQKSKKYEFKLFSTAFARVRRLTPVFTRKSKQMIFE